MSRAAAMFPWAGAVIGLVPATILVAALASGLPPSIGAPLAIAALVATTGALHEDGLADCADGFGGGRTRDRKLEIMRDSRIGTFGACAIALSLYIRTLALAAIAARSTELAAAVLVMTASLSRALCLIPLLLLKPARPDGLGANAGKPTLRDVLIALAQAACLGLATSMVGASLPRILMSFLIAGASVLAICGLGRRQIGGQTGDVVGLAQQAAEIGLLLTFAAS